MNVICPNCLSDQVTQIVNQQVSGTESSALAASASFATIGASISKSLPLPVSPLIGGLAGVVIGGVLNSIFSPAPTVSSRSYFQCQSCGLNFH